MSIQKTVLYWSGFEAYEQCPQKYLWSYGWGALDVGGGPGRKKPRPVQDSQHHPFMGTVIAAVIERLYNDELWRNPTQVHKTLQELTDREFNYQLHHHNIDWELALRREGLTKEGIRNLCHSGVQGFLHTLKGQRLLGEYARAEVLMKGWVNKYTPIGGRADLILRRGEEIMILDGKNSKSRGKYTNPDQIRWYALCFYLEHTQLPHKGGFIYFRYPYGTPLEDGTVYEGIDWVTIDREDIKGLAQRVIDAYRQMEKENFPAKPVASVCNLCAYETVCPERQQTKKTREKTPVLSVAEHGFEEISFSGKKV